MKKTFIIFSTIVFLLFNVFSVNISAQCTGLVEETTGDITITNTTVGQSWIADCTGFVQTIKVSSGLFSLSASNLTLRIWEQDIPLLGQISVIHIQTGISLPGGGVATTISIPSVPIDAAKTYFFTLTAASGPNPAKESITIETSATDKHDVKIMDYMGRIWLSKSLDNSISQINIASLPKGLYFMECLIDNELVRRKIVKE